MKKRLLGKVLTAFIILAVSTLFVNLHGQVKVIFENGDVKADHRTEGLAGRDALHLNFTIDGSGNIVLDTLVSPSTNDKVKTLLESWEDDDAGTTDIASLFGKSFSLVLTTNGNRLDCREKGGLGIQGMNSGRIDGNGGEELYITLEGSVGVKIDSLMYERTERGGGDNAHFVLRDWDTDSLFYTPAGDTIKTPTDTTFVPDSVIAFDAGLLELRFATEKLTVKESDTLSGGGRVLGLFFTLMEPTNPSVAGISPAPGEERIGVDSDFVILFNMPMNTATTETAVAFTPALTNRTNTWNGAGDELTISSDDLDFFTDYNLAISTDAVSADAVNSLVSLSYDYQTLPDNPTVIGGYPLQLGKEHVPANTPLVLEFSQPMIPDSVEKAISFEPALTGLKFVWNEDNSKVFITSDGMETAIYVVTLSTVATDIYGQQMVAPLQVSFNTWPVSAEDSKVSAVALYPNPATDLMEIRGMDVASVKIFSLAGQLVKAVYDTSVVNVGDMEPGSYVVTVSDREDNSVRKMIVIK